MATQTPWHAQSVRQCLADLDVDPKQGLTAEKVQRRRAEVGANELAERPRPGLARMLWEQFDSFLVLILVAAAGLSLFRSGWN